MKRATLALAILVSSVALPGCEYVASVRGLLSAVNEIEQHLEEDLAAPLTDDKITLLLTVTPKLKEFTKTAKHKWEPDPSASDLSQLANALGGLSDYIAFFESHQTRITEYYVLMLKVHDARGQILWRRAYEEAAAKHEKERAELEKKRAAASTPEEEQKIDAELERNRLASKKLEQTRAEQQQAHEDRRRAHGKNTYEPLSDGEIALVEARLDEITEVFQAAGYIKGDPALPVKADES